MSRRSSRRGHGIAALAGSFTGALLVTSLALAGFSSSSTATETVQTKRVFLGSRVVAAHDLTDASNGTAAGKDTALDYADAVVATTGNWAKTFATNRYVRFDFNAPLPAGVPVSSVTFDFRIIPAAGADNACYYLEVHRISDDSLVGTHYSSGSPQCATGTTYSTVSTALSEVTSSDVANDLYVKVFGTESASKGWKIDLATVTLSLYGQSVTQFAEAYTDAADGSAAAGSVLGLDAAGDGLTYTDASNWPTAYATTKYLQFGFTGIVPSGAVITSVTFDRTWRSAGTQTVCYYIDVYSGASLIGTHGSASQISCSNSTTVWNTDSTPLPEVTSATDADQLFIRVYGKSSPGQKSVDDLDTITITYYLD